MHSTLRKWLDELEEEIEIVISTEIKEEANGNMVIFGFDEELLNGWGKKSVTEFLSACSELYEKKSKGHDMVFYSWLDDQAGHIRISAVQQSHGRLPFNCKLNRASLSEVVNGIYSYDSGLLSRGTLDVWQKNI